MGGGSFDYNQYHDAAASRAARGVSSFAYSQTAAQTQTVHPDLDPARITKKVHGKLESRDSREHPESTAVLMCFDVTGSNRERAVVAQQALPNLMTLLQKYLPHPQVAVASNDDYKAQGRAGAIQISEFESDNRIDEHIRNIWLVGNGGGNGGESYDLLLYAAARKTVLDSVEKRGKKGYLFLYADEPFFEQVSCAEVRDVFGDSLDQNIPIRTIIEEARKQYEIFLLWPRGGYTDAYQQYQRLFGREFVLTLEDPNKICEVVGATIGINEEKVDAAAAVQDLVAVGQDRTTAQNLVAGLVPLSRTKEVATFSGGSLARSGRPTARL